MKLLHLLSALLYPDKCVLCGKILQKQESDLCHQCRIEAPECPVNSTKYPYLNSWVALWYYEDKVSKSLLLYKFYGRRNKAQSFGRLLAMKIRQQHPENPDDCLNEIQQVCESNDDFAGLLRGVREK